VSARIRLVEDEGEGSSAPALRVKLEGG
jgi:hypothetical protein